MLNLPKPNNVESSFASSSPSEPCPPDACSCRPQLARREFLKLTGLTAAGTFIPSLPVMAGPFESGEFEKLIPADKKLDPQWVKSLFERGTRTVYRGAELEKIGMPVGGICTGQLYLGGDGRLWHWDIFNKVAGTGDRHYAHPPAASSPLEQGFALFLSVGGKSQVRALDHSGWSEVTFTGEYPLGFVDYADPQSPVQVALEAFSPFIPLNAEDSSLPATVLRFTLKNTAAEPVEAELAGWLENAVCLHSGQTSLGLRRNRVLRKDGFMFLECAAEALPLPKRAERRPDITFADFEQETYQGWTAQGTAFGSGPIEKGKIPSYQGDVGAKGQRLVNSHATAPGKDVGEKDSAIGTLTSRTFVIERDYITFLIGGGGHQGRTCLNLIVEEKAVLSATGKNDNRMLAHSFDVRPWAGKLAKLQIVDQEKGAWGNIGIDDIVFSDQPREPAVPLPEQFDFGTMGLALLKTDKAAAEGSPQAETRADLANTSLPARHVPDGLFSKATAGSDAPASKPFNQKLVGALTRRLTLAPGQAVTVSFVVTWHFPNIKLGGLGEYEGRHYGKRFAGAAAVAEYVAQNFERLSAQTRLWHDTWYDSTLPYWFLDRTFLNTSILATNTCYWFGNGRFYAWEGVGCCAGTCTHVWHYAQAVARLFPSLERTLREQTDYGVGFERETGRIRFRAEHNNHWAVDGQAGVILRTYREHQMSADDQFLRRVWPLAKKALQFLIEKDGNADGVLEGPQHNTLDADWFGQVAWLSGLYLAALRAGEAMAQELGDAAFATQCREIFARGQKYLDEKLFNGEYYIQIPDLKNLAAVGSFDGCEIDQVLGQSWAWQVGLGRITDAAQTKTALRSLWKYNFTPDVGPWRAAKKPGRWYALAGEGGLIMCTHPKGPPKEFKDHPSAWSAMYFNECMTGFEYQAAWHMVAEGLVQEGLAVTRAIHDRYHAARRNPWNEVECGDHYARAMASYGVYLAACGYEYHGPQGHLGFAPRLTPDNFRAAFTAAEGWGTFSRQAAGGKQKATLAIKTGRLRLRTVSLAPAGNQQLTQVAAILAGKPIAARLTVDGDRARITFENEVRIHAGETLEVVLS